jgi:CrcB protein
MLYSFYLKKGVSLQTILFIGIGGFIGAIARYFITLFMQSHVMQNFPIGTLTVNILGSFLIGFLALYFEHISSAEYKVLVITGFLGALTTFSTFSFESVMLIENGAFLKAFVSILLNLTLSLGATFLAITLFKKFFI